MCTGTKGSSPSVFSLVDSDLEDHLLALLEGEPLERDTGGRGPGIASGLGSFLHGKLICSQSGGG